MKKKILVTGGTGAMGRYLVPLLIEMGYAVDVIAQDAFESTSPDLRYIIGDAKDADYMREFLKNGYDGVVDFMIYRTDEIAKWLPIYLDSTEHYIYLSSYRVYANEEHPIKETSPRLLDVSDDKDYLASDDYSLYKARGEDYLLASEYKNWTAIRPAITYSSRRFQLVTLEMNNTVERAILGKKAVLPLEAKDVQATMSWAGDVAKMIARLLFNDRAYREIFTVSTAEHRTWGEVAEYYRELIGLEYEWVSNDDYISAIGGHIGSYRQLWYDRLFDRIIDNSKILDVTGMKQEELMPLKEGLRYEISKLPRDIFTDRNSTMDEWFVKNNKEYRVKYKL